MNFKKFLIKNSSDAGYNLNLYNQRFSDQDIEELIAFLKSDTSIISINLDKTSIEDDHIIKLMTISSLVSLNLSHNSIGEPAIEALAKSKLKKLNLMDCCLEDSHLQFFESNQHLEMLTLSDNLMITEEGIRVLKSTKIKILSISNLFDNGDGIAKSLSGEDAPFEELILSQNEMTDEGLKALANNKNLKKISLFLNHITYKGAEYLLKHLPTIEFKSLDNNDISAEELAKLKNKQKKLKASVVSNQAGTMFSAPESKSTQQAIWEIREAVNQAVNQTVNSFKNKYSPETISEALNFNLTDFKEAKESNQQAHILPRPKEVF